MTPDIAYHRLRGEGFSATLAKQAVIAIFRDAPSCAAKIDPEAPATRIRDIALETAAEFGIPFKQIVGVSRAHRYVWPRQVAMARAYATGRFSSAQIGAVFSRHHTTVIHARQKVAKFNADLAENPLTAADLAAWAGLGAAA